MQVGIIRVTRSVEIANISTRPSSDKMLELSSLSNILCSGTAKGEKLIPVT